MGFCVYNNIRRSNPSKYYRNSINFKEGELLLENLSVVIPKNLENLQLPDPDLLHLYEDEEARRIYLEGVIGTEDDPTNDNSIGIVKRILRYNREDRGLSPSERKPIMLYIDSPGGDVTGALVLCHIIMMSKTPIYTVNMCACFSASGVILSCGHKRYALKGSSVLIHSGSTYLGGTREQADSAKKFVDKSGKKFNDILFKNTKIDQKTYRSKAPKDWFLDDEECLKYGVIDEIVEDIDSIL